MIRKPLEGLQFLEQGFRLILEPSVRLYVLIPLIINVLVFLAGYAFVFYQVQWLANWVASSVPEWLTWISWLLWPIALLVLVFATVYLFTLVANLIASPFNGLLSEKIEVVLTGKTESATVGGWLGMLKSLLPTLINEIRKIAYFLVFAVPLVVCMFIPVVNVFIAPLWFIFGCWMQALQYVDIPMSNRGLVFKDVKAECAGSRLLSLGFGAGVTVLAAIPVVNLFVMPAAVAGATALYIQRSREA